MTSPGPKTIYLNNTLQIINLVVLVVGGGLGYVLVDRVNTKIDETKLRLEETKVQLDKTKLSIDISKFLNDIRPTLINTCTAWATSDIQIKVSCTIKNIGAHRILIAKPIAKLRVDGYEQFVDQQHYSQRFLHTNALPPGTEGTSSYVIDVPKPADWAKVELITQIDASTDDIIIKIAKDTLDGQIEPTHIQTLARHGYMYSSPIDVSYIKNIALPAQP